MARATSGSFTPASRASTKEMVSGTPGEFIIPYPPRRLEAEVGIEPTHKGFADPCLTTWLLRHRATSFSSQEEVRGGPMS
jgi:hypothetical protein